jgi:hypothetical protein
MLGIVAQLSDMLLAVLAILLWFPIHSGLASAGKTDRIAVAVLAFTTMLSLLAHSMVTSVMPDPAIERVLGPVSHTLMAIYPIVVCVALLRVAFRNRGSKVRV